jgi:hypothetical protein
MQQGRVTLEADWNEAQQIAGEELRKETLDIVGPSGTPDNGYQISFTGPNGQPATPPDFFIEPGTMYVGGVRVQLDATLQYSQQQEWLDHTGDPDWVDLNQVPPGEDEFVYLYLREQEVSAVEDTDLKDVALGGPDTAQRTRLVQHIVRLSTPGADCTSGLLAAEARWRSEGLAFESTTMRLLSQDSLQVGFTQVGQTDLCLPQAQGGYLSADNQLIRVQNSGPGTILWGFDDASFLYRVTVEPDNQTLTLQSAPPDAFHQPRTGQAVELLRSTVRLSNSTAEQPQYVGSPTGLVFTLGNSPYQPDDQTVTLPASLSPHPEYLDPTETPQLFLRVWEQQLTFTPGTPVALGTTGVQVTLQVASGWSFHVGDFWLFAVRPSTPQRVYPEHYLNAPQDPNGPRLWACPLGVIEQTAQSPPASPPGEEFAAVDCRNAFSPLTAIPMPERGMRVTDVRLLNAATGAYTPLIHDSNVTATNLMEGIDVQCSALVDPASVTRASCLVTVEVPFSVTGSPVAGQTVAYQEITLAGIASAHGNTITWAPNPFTARTLPQLPSLVSASDRGMLTRLILKGNHIRSQDDPPLHLHSEALGSRGAAGSGISVRLPSGTSSGHRDFEMWFWLVAPPPVLTGFQLDRTPIALGQTATATVSLSGAAPAGGIVIMISNPAPNVATVPASFTIPAGSASGQFVIQTRAPGQTTLRASLGKVNLPTTLAIMMPSITHG